MKESFVFVGIDVSKECLDVAVRPSGEIWQVCHDSLGIGEVVERLETLMPQNDSAGGYWRSGNDPGRGAGACGHGYH